MACDSRAANCSCQKGIDYPHPARNSSRLQILRVEYRRTRRPRCVNNQGIPKRNLRQTAQFDRGDDIVRAKTNDSGARHYFDLSLCDVRRQAKLARRRCEVLLENLQRQRRRSIAETLRKKSSALVQFFAVELPSA